MAGKAWGVVTELAAAAIGAAGLAAGRTDNPALNRCAVPRPRTRGERRREPSPGTLRVRLCHERRRHGCFCVTVELHKSEVEKLIRS